LKLSVAVNSWDNVECLDLFVRSFQENTVGDVELCVALDGSPQESIDLVEAAGVKYVWDEHKGIGPSMNNALSLCTGEFVFWASDDYVLMPGWDQNVLKYLHPEHYFSVELVEPFPGSFPPAANFGTSPGVLDYKGLMDYFSNRHLLIQGYLGKIFGNGIFHLQRALDVGGFDLGYNFGGMNDIGFYYKLYRHYQDMIFFTPRDISVYHFSRATKKKHPDLVMTPPSVFLEKNGVSVDEAYRNIERRSLNRRSILESRGIFLEA